MIYEVNGLPVHVLLVHAVVVLVPLAALLTVLAALWPAARRRLGVITPLAALAALIVVPITANAGEWLQARLPRSPLINEHVGLGLTMIWFAIGLFVASVLAWGVPTLIVRRTKAAPAPWVGVVIAVVAVVLAGAAVFQVFRVGESGSKAVWEGSFCPVPVNTDGTCPTP
ncbi:MAG TPA: DUF2231 domain-containing protein [Nakamurella sp.]